MRYLLHSILILITAFPFFASATMLSSEWGSTVYLRQDQLDSARSRLNAYEGLNLQVRNIAGSDISVYADVAGTNGFGSMTRKNMELTHGYIDWNNIGTVLDLRLGRQHNYEGTYSSYFDGLKLRGRLGRNFGIMGYAGAVVLSRFVPDFIYTQVDSNLFDMGVRGTGTFGGTQAGITFRNEQSKSDVLDQDIGLDLSERISNWVYAQGYATYDITGKTFDEFQAGASVNAGEHIGVSASLYRNNRVRIDSSNIFVKRVFQHYYQADGSVVYAFTPRLRASAGYLARIFDTTSEVAHEANARIDYNKYNLGFVQRWGYGGWETRIDAGAGLPKLSVFTVGIKGSFLRYAPADTAADVNIAWTGDLFIDASAPAASWWNVRLGVQGAGNPYYTFDVRGYLTTSISFSRFTK